MTKSLATPRRIVAGRARKRQPRGVTYGTYAFLDKNPVIDELRTLIGDTPLTAIERKTGVTANTMRRWLHGETIRPQEPTLNAVARYFGHKLAFVPVDDARGRLRVVK